jgi:hypothetical protein
MKIIFKRLFNRTGDLSPIIAGGIIIVALAAVITVLSANKKVQTNASQAESANELAARKLEDLVNLPWNHADLSTLGSDNPHTSGSLTWTVTNPAGKPRLKQIVLRSQLQQKVTRALANQSVGIVGFKYDDF